MAARMYARLTNSGQGPDFFVRDREAGKISRISLTVSGGEGNNASFRYEQPWECDRLSLTGI